MPATADHGTPQLLGGDRELLVPQAIMLRIGRQADCSMAAALAPIPVAVVGLAHLSRARLLTLRHG